MADPAKIFIVEDEKPIARLLQLTMLFEGKARNADNPIAQ